MRVSVTNLIVVNMQRVVKNSGQARKIGFQSKGGVAALVTAVGDLE